MLLRFVSKRLTCNCQYYGESFSHKYALNLLKNRDYERVCTMFKRNEPLCEVNLPSVSYRNLAQMKRKLLKKLVMSTQDCCYIAVVIINGAITSWMLIVPTRRDLLIIVSFFSFFFCFLQGSSLHGTFSQHQVISKAWQVFYKIHVLQ